MMLHCPNLNDTRSAGPLTEADLDASIADAYMPACTANACNSGRAPCPCPDACRLPGDGSLARVGLAACVVSAVIVCALVSIACAAIGVWIKN